MFPLERELACRIVGLVDDHVDEDPACELLMEPRRGEVHVPRDNVSGFDQDLAEKMLSASPLVRRNQLLVPVHIVDGVNQLVEAVGAGVRLISEHQSRPLAIGHRRRARVGEQVDVDIGRLEQERVESGLVDRPLAILARGHRDGFDHLDLPWLCPASMIGHGLLLRLRRARSRCHESDRLGSRHRSRAAPASR